MVWHAQYALLVLVCIFTSSLFSASTHNPLGLPFAREVFIAFLTAYVFSSIFITLAAGKKISWLLRWLLLLAFVPWLWSAIIANLVHGQPVYFALIEDRRILELLAAYVIFDLARRCGLSATGLLGILFYVALLCAALGIAFQLEFVPDLRLQFGEFDEKSGSGLRDNRASIGLTYMVMMFFAAMVAYRGAGSGMRMRLPLLWLTFFLIVIVFVGQTRQIFMALLASAFLFAISSWRRFFVYSFLSFPVLMAMVLAIMMIFPEEKIVGFWELLTQVADDQYLYESARALTISVIMDEVAGGLAFGGGSLSLLWEGGFHRVYGEFFFLADVGDFGVIYRFGYLSIFYFWAVLYFLWRNYREMPGGTTKSLVGLCMIYVCITSLSAGFHMYQGLFMSVIIALAQLEKHRAMETR